VRRRTWLIAVVFLCASAAGACSSSSAEGAKPVAAFTPVAFTGDEASFYVPPAPLPDGTHGDLIRYQRYADDDGRRIYRVMYLSESIAGDPIAVTGLVALPDDEKTDRVVLAWAHGTTGIADACAPSRQPLGIMSAPLDLFLQRGWIVAATDYEGLGTPGRHPYIAGVSEGRGVLDAVRAASQLPSSHAGDRTLIWGHSQGGHAAMFAAEIARRWTPERSVLGTVAGAPPSQLPELFHSLATGEYRSYLALAAAGLHAAYPSARLGDILTAKGLDLLPVVDRGCSDDVRHAFREVPVSEFLKADPSSVPSWKAVLAENEPGRVTAPSPLLIIHGENDEQIPLDTSRALFEELCAKGQVVERRTYPGQSHVGVLLPSFLPMLTWMDARVKGTPAATGCP
jgi:acetyl esterase/lipase